MPTRKLTLDQIRDFALKNGEKLFGMLNSTECICCHLIRELKPDAKRIVYLDSCPEIMVDKATYKVPQIFHDWTMGLPLTNFAQYSGNFVANAIDKMVSSAP